MPLKEGQGIGTCQPNGRRGNVTKRLLLIVQAIYRSPEMKAQGQVTLIAGVYMYGRICSSFHSQNILAIPLPPSASVFTATARSFRMSMNLPHGTTVALGGPVSNESYLKNKG